MASRCRPSHQLIHNEATVVAQSANRFPPLQLRMKGKTFNRHNTGKTVTVNEDTSRDSILR